MGKCLSTPNLSFVLIILHIPDIWNTSLHLYKLKRSSQQGSFVQSLVETGPVVMEKMSFKTLNPIFTFSYLFTWISHLKGTWHLFEQS